MQRLIIYALSVTVGLSAVKIVAHWRTRGLRWGDPTLRYYVHSFAFFFSFVVARYVALRTGQEELWLDAIWAASGLLWGISLVRGGNLR